MSSERRAVSPKIKLLAAVLLVAVPPLIFYTLLWAQQSPVPLQDDYSALLDFALRWQRVASFGDRVSLFLSARDGDYKLYFDHVCVLGSLGLLHRVSILPLCWLGNALWFAVAALLWQQSNAQGRSIAGRLFLFAPASLLLFQLNGAETFNWAMAGLQNVGVVFFSMAAIAALLEAGWKWSIVSFVLCFAALCASANGFLLLPIALVLLARKQPVRALLLTFMFALTAGVYHWRLQVAPKRLATLQENAGFALNFIGGAVESIRGKPFHGAALSLGVAMIVTAAVLIVHGMRWRNPFLFWATVWIFLTAALVTVGRAGAGAELARSGRYKIYSDLLLAVLYLDAASLAHRFVQARWRPIFYSAALPVACLMCVAADREGFLFLQARRVAGEAQFAEFLSSPSETEALPKPESPPHTATRPLDTYMRLVLQQSIATGIYRQPASVAHRTL